MGKRRRERQGGQPAKRQAAVGNVSQNDMQIVNNQAEVEDQNQTSQREREITFGRKLAASDKTTRDRAVRKLRLWLSKQTNLSPLDNRKIWKGLFYCMWMSDKPLVQEDLANAMSDMILQLSTVDGTARFVDAFFTVIGREWPDIDALRLDKYYYLLDQILRKTFDYLAKVRWDPGAVAAIVKVLRNGPLQPNGQYPKSLKWKVWESFVVQLAPAVKDDENFKAESFDLFLEAFCDLVMAEADKLSLKKLVDRVFSPLIERENILLSKLASSIENDDDSDEDEELESYIEVDWQHLSNYLMELTKKKDVGMHNQKILHGLKKKAEKIQAAMHDIAEAVEMPEEGDEEEGEEDEAEEGEEEEDEENPIDKQGSEGVPNSVNEKEDSTKGQTGHVGKAKVAKSLVKSPPSSQQQAGKRAAKLQSVVNNTTNSHVALVLRDSEKADASIAAGESEAVTIESVQDEEDKRPQSKIGKKTGIQILAQTKAGSEAGKDAQQGTALIDAQADDKSQPKNGEQSVGHEPAATGATHGSQSRKKRKAKKAGQQSPSTTSRTEDVHNKVGEALDSTTGASSALQQQFNAAAKLSAKPGQPTLGATPTKVSNQQPSCIVPMSAPAQPLGKAPMGAAKGPSMVAGTELKSARKRVQIAVEHNKVKEFNKFHRICTPYAPAVHDRKRVPSSSALKKVSAYDSSPVGKSPVNTPIKHRLRLGFA